MDGIQTTLAAAARTGATAATFAVGVWVSRLREAAATAPSGTRSADSMVSLDLVAQVTYFVSQSETMYRYR
jgi:hypothetical protein